MAATSQKQAQIGAIKDPSTSMSYLFSQLLFLQNPEICLCNPTQLYLQEEKQNIFIGVKLSTPHTTSFLRVLLDIRNGSKEIDVTPLLTNE